MPGAFETKVRACMALAPHFRGGLQAIKNVDRDHLRVEHPRYLTGSVDVDAALAFTLANWLEHNAASLGAMKCRYIWVSSGRTAISPGAPARRALAQKGPLLVGNTYTIC